MGTLILRRLVAVVPVMLLVSFAVFMLVALIPGDAATTLAGGANATEERIAEIREEYGFNDPLPVQYWEWLRGALVLDFGNSLIDGRPVMESIGARFPITMTIACVALALGVLVGSAAGIVSGMRPGSLSDGLAVLGASLGMAVPGFWLAMVLIALFSIELGWFPPGGFTPLTEDPVEWLRSIVLPAVSLGALAAATQARQLRASLIDVMNSAYVRTAWGKGGAPGRVVGKHALKNAAMPAVTVLGLQLGSLIGGAVIIEQIFSVPGLGTYLLDSVLALDLPVIQGIVVFFALIQVILMLLLDISYGLLNPKVRAS